MERTADTTVRQIFFQRNSDRFVCVFPPFESQTNKSVCKELCKIDDFSISDIITLLVLEVEIFIQWHTERETQVQRLISTCTINELFSHDQATFTSLGDVFVVLEICLTVIKVRTVVCLSLDVLWKNP